MDCQYQWEGQKPKEKRYNRQTSYTIKYPSDKIHQMKFECSEDVSKFLLINATQIGYCKWQQFEKKVYDMETYIRIVYSCKKSQCDATLVYCQKKEDFFLSREQRKQKKEKSYLGIQKVKNSHRHIIKLSPKVTKERNIRQYLFDLPVEQKVQHHLQSVKQKFNLSVCRAKYLRNRMFWKFANENDMLQKLALRNIIFRRKIENNETDLLLLTSETMKRNYMRYGDVLCFDLTYKLLKRKRKSERNIGVGFFVGQDENTRIVLFGFCMISVQTTSNFKKLFQFFFECMDNVIPKTIITDDQRAISYAFQQLKVQNNYTYVHLIDWFHKMQNIYRKMKRERYREELYSLICKLFKEHSKHVLQDILYEIGSLLRDKNIILDVIKQKNRYILSEVPQAFFGFGISSTRSEAFNSLIKKSVPYQSDMSRIVYYVFRVERKMIQKMKTLNYMNKELLISILSPQVLELSEKLQCLAFQQIRQYYQQSLLFQKIQEGQSPLNQIAHYKKYDRSYCYNLRFDIKRKCWRCQCKAIYKTGMPCSHIIGVLRKFKGSIGYYINQRWFHDKKQCENKKATRPPLRRKRI